MRRAHSTRLVGGVILLGLALLGNVCAGRAQSAEQPAVRTGEDPAISRMHLEALKTDDPDQRAKIYLEILQKDSTNAEARQGYKEAKAAGAEKHKVVAEEARKKADQRAVEARRRAALQAAERAFYSGDIFRARSLLNEARNLGESGPDLLRIERMIGNAERGGSLNRSLGFGAAGIVLTGVILWIVLLFRRGQGYVEILTGSARGRRYPIEKEVITIGALAQRGEETNDIVVSDPEKTVSRFHCEVHRKGRKFSVVDCHSANGTRLDGRAIPPGRLVPLKRGSRIQLGASCALKFGMERRKA